MPVQTAKKTTALAPIAGPKNLQITDRGKPQPINQEVAREPEQDQANPDEDGRNDEPDHGALPWCLPSGSGNPDRHGLMIAEMRDACRLISWSGLRGKVGQADTRSSVAAPPPRTAKVANREGTQRQTVDAAAGYRSVIEQHGAPEAGAACAMRSGRAPKGGARGISWIWRRARNRGQICLMVGYSSRLRITELMFVSSGNFADRLRAKPCSGARQRSR